VAVGGAITWYEKPNAQVTPWCPVIQVPFPVGPVPQRHGTPTEERPVSMYVDGVRYVLED
jgi:hypothetical protein